MTISKFNGTIELNIAKVGVHLTTQMGDNLKGPPRTQATVMKMKEFFKRIVANIIALFCYVWATGNLVIHHTFPWGERLTGEDLMAPYAILAGGLATIVFALLSWVVGLIVAIILYYGVYWPINWVVHLWARNTAGPVAPHPLKGKSP